MILFYIINAIFPFEFFEQSANQAGIAIMHSVFNIFATIIWLPFMKLLEKLAYISVRDKKDDSAPANSSKYSIPVSLQLPQLLWSSASQ